MTAPVESFAARRARYETRGAANDNFRLRLVISNKFTGQTGGSLPFTPTYDATGNMTGINNGITLVYDGRNRVASSTGAGIVTNYWVNGLGQRVRKTWNGTPASHVLFTYDPAGKHIGTYDLNGTLTEETIFLGDTPIAVVTGAGTFNLYADHINAIRQVTNQTNQTRWSWEQTNAFGSTLPNQNPSGLGNFNYRRGFPGQFYDAELLTWNNGFRTYHAGLGRYLQPDPIGLAGGDPSMFGYVGQIPNMATDMLGLQGFGTFPSDQLSPSPGLADQFNPFGMFGDGTRNYTKYFNKRFATTVHYAKKTLVERIKKKICLNKNSPRVSGMQGGLDDVDVDHGLMKRIGEAPEDWYESMVQIGEFEIKTDDVTVQWDQQTENCKQCYTFHTVAYVWENTGENERFGRLGRMVFKERKLREANWQLSDKGCCNE